MRFVRHRARVLVALCLGILGVSGCGVTTGTMPTTTASGDPARIPIEVQKPSGAGPFPAVVIAHDCSVGLMGGSHGGSTTLASMLAADGDTDALAAEKRAGFAAGVALYPSCAPSARTWHTTSGIYRPIGPLLILIGDKDDWTPAPPCEALATAARRAGYPVSITIYPNAHHSFDSPNPIRFVATRINANAPGGRGATTGGDPTAWSDAIQQVTKFFGEHLK